MKRCFGCLPYMPCMHLTRYCNLSVQLTATSIPIYHYLFYFHYSLSLSLSLSLLHGEFRDNLGSKLDFPFSSIFKNQFLYFHLTKCMLYMTYSYLTIFFKVATKGLTCINVFIFSQFD